MADNILKNIRIKHRSDTETNWISKNPVLLNGELAISSDKALFKTGDGVSTWSKLPYNRAISDSAGQTIHSTYLKNITASGQTLTLTKGDNTTRSLTMQDTKNTAGSTNSSSKLFLIGSVSQSASPQTYSRSTCYIGTDGCLYSNNTKVSVTGHTHNYLSTGGGTVDGNLTVSGVINSTKLGCHIVDANVKTAFRTQCGISAGAYSGAFLSAIRTNTASIYAFPQYCSGIAWGHSDTHGYITADFNVPNAYMGGGNADKLNWVRRIALMDAGENLAIPGAITARGKYVATVASWDGSTLNLSYG